MEIGTGYFAKAKVYSEMGYALVNIALKQPWFLPDGLVLHETKYKPCPNESILDLKDKPAEYEDRFQKEVLRFISPYDFYTELFRISKLEHTEKVVLLCYEAPDKFCHRHIVAKWIKDCLGITVEELVPQIRQMDMFLGGSDV